MWITPWCTGVNSPCDWLGGQCMSLDLSILIVYEGWVLSIKTELNALIDWYIVTMCFLYRKFAQGKFNSDSILFCWACVISTHWLPLPLTHAQLDAVLTHTALYCQVVPSDWPGEVKLGRERRTRSELNLFCDARGLTCSLCNLSWATTKHAGVCATTALHTSSRTTVSLSDMPIEFSLWFPKRPGSLPCWPGLGGNVPGKNVGIQRLEWVAVDFSCCCPYLLAGALFAAWLRVRFVSLNAVYA